MVMISAVLLSVSVFHLSFGQLRTKADKMSSPQLNLNFKSEFHMRNCPLCFLYSVSPSFPLFLLTLSLLFSLTVNPSLSPVCCCVKCKTDWARPPARQTLESAPSSMAASFQRALRQKNKHLSERWDSDTSCSLSLLSGISLVMTARVTDSRFTRQRGLSSRKKNKSRT